MLRNSEAKISLSFDPKDFVCPICMDIMLDPYVTHAGSSYDKECIETHFIKNGLKDPLTKDSLVDHPDIHPNRFLKNLLDDYRDLLLEVYNIPDLQQQSAQSIAKGLYFLFRYLFKRLGSRIEKKKSIAITPLEDEVLQQISEIKEKQREMASLEKKILALGQQSQQALEADNFEENEPIIEEMIATREMLQQKKMLELDPLVKAFEQKRSALSNLQDSFFHEQLSEVFRNVCTKTMRARRTYVFFKSAPQVPSALSSETRVASEMLSTYFCGRIEFALRNRGQLKVIFAENVSREDQKILSKFKNQGGLRFQISTKKEGQCIIDSIKLEKLKELCDKKPMNTMGLTKGASL